MLEWEKKRNKEAAERADKREQVGPWAVDIILTSRTAGHNVNEQIIDCARLFSTKLIGVL